MESKQPRPANLREERLQQVLLHRRLERLDLQLMGRRRERDDGQRRRRVPERLLLLLLRRKWRGLPGEAAAAAVGRERPQDLVQLGVRDARRRRRWARGGRRRSECGCCRRRAAVVDRAERALGLLDPPASLVEPLGPVELVDDAVDALERLRGRRARQRGLTRRPRTSWEGGRTFLTHGEQTEPAGRSTRSHRTLRLLHATHAWFCSGRKASTERQASARQTLQLVDQLGSWPRTEEASSLRFLAGTLLLLRSGPTEPPPEPEGPVTGVSSFGVQLDESGCRVSIVRVERAS